jgi:hypothetical protein
MVAFQLFGRLRQEDWVTQWDSGSMHSETPQTHSFHFLPHTLLQTVRKKEYKCQCVAIFHLEATRNKEKLFAGYPGHTGDRGCHTLELNAGHLGSTQGKEAHLFFSLFPLFSQRLQSVFQYFAHSPFLFFLYNLCMYVCIYIFIFKPRFLWNLNCWPPKASTGDSDTDTGTWSGLARLTLRVTFQVYFKKTGSREARGGRQGMLAHLRPLKRDDVTGLCDSTGFSSECCFHCAKDSPSRELGWWKPWEETCVHMWA